MAAGGSVVADQAAMVAEDQAVATTAPEEPQASGGKQAPEEANATLEMYPGGTWNVIRLRPVIRAQPFAGELTNSARAELAASQPWRADPPTLRRSCRGFHPSSAPW